MNALIITEMTAVRMNVIADRTQNLLAAGAKAMMIENLKEKLRNGIAHFLSSTYKCNFLGADNKQ